MADIVLDTWQWQFNSVVMGPDTNYGIISVSGMDPSDIRLDDTQKMASHGDWLYATYYDKRVVTITGDVHDDSGDPTSFGADLIALRQAFIAQPNDLPLRTNLPGWGPVLTYVKPTKFHYDLDIAYSIQYTQWSVELQGQDPRIYVDTPEIITTGPEITNGLDFGGPGGGLDFGGPGTGLDFGGGSGGLVTATNIGTVAADPLITVFGPCGSPISISNLTQSRALTAYVALAAGDYLQFDAQMRTVMLNGQSSRYSSLDLNSKWWDIAPGDNNILFTATAPGGACQCTVSFSSAWM